MKEALFVLWIHTLTYVGDNGSTIYVSKDIDQRYTTEAECETAAQVHLIIETDQLPADQNYLVYAECVGPTETITYFQM